MTEADGSRHCGQMNSLGWIVGHLAWHEQRILLDRAQGILVVPSLPEQFFSGAPMSTPPLGEMLKAWRKVTRTTDPFLDTFGGEDLLKDLLRNGKSVGQSYGSAVQRLTYHYWFHIGEIQAIRQVLGHKRLPIYVGNIETKAPYRRE